MPNNENQPLDSMLMLTIALAMIAENKSLGAVLLSMDDYRALTQWLGVKQYIPYTGKIKIDKAIRNHLTLGLRISTGCDEDYIVTHLLHHLRNKYKEL